MPHAESDEPPAELLVPLDTAESEHQRLSSALDRAPALHQTTIIAEASSTATPHPLNGTSRAVQLQPTPPTLRGTRYASRLSSSAPSLLGDALPRTPSGNGAVSPADFRAGTTPRRRQTPRPVRPGGRLRARQIIPAINRRLTESQRNLRRQGGKIGSEVADTLAQVPEAWHRACEYSTEARQISNGRYYLLVLAFVLLLCIVLLQLTGWVLQLAARLSKLYWLAQLSGEYKEFRLWTLEVCRDPWQKETVLCQAAEGSFIARELIRAKLATRDEDHCDPADSADGCRHTPCPLTRGLSSTLLELADGWRSPLNNPFHRLYLVLRPVRSQIRSLLRSIAEGDMSLSEVDKKLRDFPWGARLSGDNWFGLRSGTDRVKTALLLKIVYPALRKWGVIIGGSVTPSPKECAPGVLSIKPPHAGGEDVELAWRVVSDWISDGLSAIQEALGDLAIEDALDE